MNKGMSYLAQPGYRVGPFPTNHSLTSSPLSTLPVANNDDANKPLRFTTHVAALKNGAHRHFDGAFLLTFKHPSRERMRELGIPQNFFKQFFTSMTSRGVMMNELGDASGGVALVVSVQFANYMMAKLDAEWVDEVAPPRQVTVKLFMELFTPPMAVGSVSARSNEGRYETGKAPSLPSLPVNPIATEAKGQITANDMWNTMDTHGRTGVDRVPIGPTSSLFFVVRPVRNTVRGVRDGTFSRTYRISREYPEETVQDLRETTVMMHGWSTETTANPFTHFAIHQDVDGGNLGDRLRMWAGNGNGNLAYVHVGRGFFHHTRRSDGTPEYLGSHVAPVSGRDNPQLIIQLDKRWTYC